MEGHPRQTLHSPNRNDEQVCGARDVRQLVRLEPREPRGSLLVGMPRSACGRSAARRRLRPGQAREAR